MTHENDSCLCHIAHKRESFSWVKIIHAEGEYQAAERLVSAANTIASEPIALQLRYLQTLTEIGVERNTTVVFPVPINLLEGFFKRDGMSDAVASKKREPVGAV